MKSSFFLSAAVLLSAATSHAQTTPTSLQSEISIDKRVEGNLKKQRKEDRKELKLLKGNQVSPLTTDEFKRNFGDITVVAWERLDVFDEATFTKDGQSMSAFYDDQSKLVGTTQSKTFADLPAKAQRVIRDDYNGYTPGDVVFFDDNELNETDMVLYGNRFDDVDSYFVELKKDNRKIVLQVSTDGSVSYFTRLR